MLKLKGIFTIFLLPVMLCGCAAHVDPEVVEFINEVKNKKIEFRSTLPKFPHAKSFKYTAEHLRNPFQAFAPAKADVAPTPDYQGGGPELNRPRGPLEAYPLDSLQMVGTLEKAGEFFALLKDNSGEVHTAEVGDYIGQNSGKIEKINESLMKVREWLSNGKGGWREHETTLPLYEAQNSPPKKQ